MLPLSPRLAFPPFFVCDRRTVIVISPFLFFPPFIRILRLARCWELKDSLLLLSFLGCPSISSPHCFCDCGEGGMGSISSLFFLPFILYRQYSGRFLLWFFFLTSLLCRWRLWMLIELVSPPCFQGAGFC